MSPATSFRDPAGVCFRVDQRILRLVEPGSVAQLEAFLASGAARRFLASRQIVSSRKLDAAEVAGLSQNDRWAALAKHCPGGSVFEHERVAFASYPCEWSPEMLFAAATLTLDLAEAALDDGFGLKDATPDNVLFRGPDPVFIDVTSFEPRVPGDPVWKPHAQFVRTFLLPLLVNRRWGLRLADVFTTRRDGLEPEEVFRLCGPLQKLRPPFLTLVSIPTWLGRKQDPGNTTIYQVEPMADREKAEFILRNVFQRLRRALNRLKPVAARPSTWSNYMESLSYTDQSFAAKEAFVQAALQEFKPARVLDVGANTGHFSVLAAQAGARVVSLDTDATCAGTLWQRARAGALDVLPLVVNFARPTPALGWRNGECPSFLERATGAAEAVLMLAVLHHLLVTDRVPLAEVLDAAAQLTTDLLVIEFVAPEDEMFRRIARGRESLHAGLNAPAFESACRERFELVRQARLGTSHRWIYLLRKKRG